MIFDDIANILDYDPLSGEFRWGRRLESHFKAKWAYRRWQATHAGEVAGFIDAEGYRQIKIQGRPYRAHRLAWLIVHGSFPGGEIDHINGVRGDNRIENLRVVTPSENSRNRRMPETNKSGAVGVCWVKARKRWMATIYREGRQINLGYFADLAEAIARRSEAQTAENYHQNHGRV